MGCKRLASIFLLSFLLILSVSPLVYAQIFSDGFESGDLTAWTGTAGAQGVNVTETNPKYDNYRAESETSGAWSLVGYVYKNLGATYDILYARCYMGFNETDLRIGANRYSRIIKFDEDSSSDTNDYIAYGLNHHNTTHFRLWFRFIEANGTTMNYIGADYLSWSLINGTLTALEVYANKTAHSDVDVQMWYGGVLYVDETGLNMTLNGDFDYVWVGALWIDVTSSQNCIFFWDSCVVDTSYIGLIVEGQDLSFPLFENINVLSSISKTMELSNTLFQNVVGWSSLTPNKEKGFSLFENILLFSSVSRGIELANTLFESPQVWSSLTASIELSVLDLAFILFENTLVFPSLSRGIEIARSFSGTVNVWSSLATATEGIAQDLAFTLFETVMPLAVLISTVAEAYVLADALALAAIAFVLAIVAICLLFAFKKES